jgi:3-methyl-2-oxobutanoate hydroxymethyltransferase
MTLYLYKMSKRTILSLCKNKLQGIKSVGVTAYDYPFARIVDTCKNIDFVIVGDTVGSTVHGIHDLNKVTMDTMVTHCEAVARGAQRPFLIGDMPFMSYQSSTQRAIENAGRLVAAGMDAVKLEGFYPDHINSINGAGMIAMAHLGLTPQTRAKLGGYRIQAKTSHEIDKLVRQSIDIQKAGASLLLLEAVPNDVGAIVTKELDIPVYGIGAGNKVDGQVVIIHDLLGMFWDFTPRFIKRYANCENVISKALTEYASDVRNVKFPSEEYFYNLNSEELEKYLEMKSWKYLKKYDT